MVNNGPLYFGMSKIIIAIDGYSSCGKSTTARQVAARLRYAYIDTGAMYRAVTLYIRDRHVSLTNPGEVAKALDDIHITFRHHPETGLNETFLNEVNVERDIRSMAVSEQVSEVSAVPAVRHAMVAQQQRMGKGKGVVMDGRDIGTVVFPQAELKVFMTADPLIRAQRRQAELMEKGEIHDLDTVLKNIEKRDYADTHRSEGPLVRAKDALLLDNSFITVAEQVDLVVGWADRLVAGALRRKEQHNV